MHHNVKSVLKLNGKLSLSVRISVQQQSKEMPLHK